MNEPLEISVILFTTLVKEDVTLGTVIAVVNANDKDLGENGLIDISDKLPFMLNVKSNNYYEFVLSESVYCTMIAEYDIAFTVTDRGIPTLSDTKTDF